MLKLKFSPNVPITLSLLDPTGEYDFDLQMGQYETVDGKSLVLPRAAVITLNMLEPRPGEEIGICYRISKGEPPKWDIWLTPKSERIRAGEESAIPDDSSPATLSETLQSSITQAELKKGLREIKRSVRHATTLDPNPLDLGTGTDGPLPVIVPLLPALALENAPRKLRPVPIPWNVAFREVSAWVARELKANDLQWGDDAQKSMVCTVLIAEVKAGRISQWEREE